MGSQFAKLAPNIVKATLTKITKDDKFTKPLEKIVFGLRHTGFIQGTNLMGGLKIVDANGQDVGTSKINYVLSDNDFSDLKGINVTLQVAATTPTGNYSIILTNGAGDSNKLPIEVVSPGND